EVGGGWGWGGGLFGSPPGRAGGSGRLFQDVDPAGLAEPDDMGEADPRSVDLPLAALAPQVLADLPYVRDPGGADRMPLGLHATGHVDRQAGVSPGKPAVGPAPTA